MKNINKKRIFKIIALSFLFLFLSISASQAAYLTFTPQVGIPGKFDQSVNLEGSSGTKYIAEFVKAIYDYGVSVGAILAAIMLMAGGLIWLTSGGSQEKVSKAKDIIFGSVVGLFLLVGAYTILNTINPKLVNLELSSIKTIEKVEPGCCEYYTYPTGSIPPKMQTDLKMSISPGVNPVISSQLMNSEESCKNLKGVYMSNTSIKMGGNWKKIGYVPEPNKINGACVKMGCCEITFKKPTAVLTNPHTIKFPLDRNSCLDGQTLDINNTEIEDNWQQTVSWSSNYCTYEGNVKNCSHEPDGTHCFYWGDGTWQKEVLNALDFHVERDCLHDYKCGICYNGSCLPKLGRLNEICGNLNNLGYCYEVNNCNNVSQIIELQEVKTGRRCQNGICCH